MIIEYIIDKDAYKKLLSRINFTASNGQVIIKRSSKAQGKENFFLKLSCAQNDIAAAQALSEVGIKVEELFIQNKITYRLLLNEASQFFVKHLYPYVCEFETKLRKFIYCTLFDINEEAKPKVLSRLQKSLIDKSSKDIPAFDFLEQGTLEDILNFLFSNAALYGEINDYTKNNSKRFSTREEIIEFIKNSDKHTIWEEFFANKFGDSSLPNTFEKIIKFRNDTMHFHNINYDYYLQGIVMLKDAIKDLDTQIKKGIVIEDSSENVIKLSENLNYVQGVIKSLEIFGLASQKIIKSLYNPTYLEALRKISDTLLKVPQVHIPDALIPLQNLALSNAISQIAVSLPSPLVGLEPVFSQDDFEQNIEETKDSE